METENIQHIVADSRKRLLEDTEIISECDNQQEVSEHKKPKLEEQAVPEETIPIPILDQESEDEEYSPIPEEDAEDEPIEPTHFSDEEQGEINIDIADYERFKANMEKEEQTLHTVTNEEEGEETTDQNTSEVSQALEENVSKSMEEADID